MISQILYTFYYSSNSYNHGLDSIILQQCGLYIPLPHNYVGLCLHIMLQNLLNMLFRISQFFAYYASQI